MIEHVIYAARYAGPTDHNGARVIVRHVGTGERTIVPRDFRVNAGDAERHAVCTVAGVGTASYAGELAGWRLFSV